MEEILNAKIEKAKELFGEDINTEENTALGKYIRINAYDQYVVEELAEKIYYSISPTTAFGQSLDRLGWTVGMTRNAATPSRYIVGVTGKAGEIVEFGFLVGTETELHFYNTADTVIGEDGTCEILVECVEAGIIGNVSASEINQIVNPVAAVHTVIGISLVEVGADKESDYDFIKRFEIVREGKGSCNEASIVSALANIPTVHGAYIVSNESATETVDGIPPKTIACFVNGGAKYPQEIGEAIFDKKPVGVGTYGDQSVMVAYGGLTDYTVNFSYAKEIDVYVSIELVTGADFEANGNQQIQNNIATFIETLGIGKTLVVTALYAHIYNVNGVTAAMVKVSKDGVTYDANDISINPYECLSFKQLTINGVVV